MDDTTIAFDKHKLFGAISDIQTGIHDMNKALNDADDYARPLVSHWKGAAAEAYNDRHRKWNQAAQELAHTLNEIKKAVEDTVHHFGKTEDGNVDLF